MRYIYTVIGIILISAGLAGVTFLKVQPSRGREAVRVNDHVVTMDEFRKAYAERSSAAPGPVDKKQFLDDLITKEVLIQEAKRRGLDLEEPFRRSIQNYYEQTLLKNLAQREMSGITVSVGDDEIEEYYGNLGKVFDLRVVSFPSVQQAEEAVRKFPSAKAEKTVLHWEEIPSDMRDAVTSLRAGDIYGKPIRRARGFLVFMLKGNRSEPVPPLDAVRDEIRKTLEERKKRDAMERWLEGLKRHSRITVDESLAKEEGL
ncbi:MAG: hypothetical protein M1497_07770 [Nitrospirae bacterium]|nr:hypothetical protein [Nitrospirota bacterium]